MEQDYDRSCGKLPQLAGFIQAGKTVAVDPKAFELVQLKLPLMDATLTFHLQGTFLNTVPPGNPETWTGLTSGTSIGHATNGGSVLLSRITGPVEQLDPDTFAIRFNRLSMPVGRRMGDIWLAASQTGDAKYKGTVQQALIKIPFRLTEGAEQNISFLKFQTSRRA